MKQKWLNSSLIGSKTPFPTSRSGRLEIRKLAASLQTKHIMRDDIHYELMLKYIFENQMSLYTKNIIVGRLKPANQELKFKSSQLRLWLACCFNYFCKNFFQLN